MIASTIIIPSLVLLAGVIDDLRTKKIHNWLVVSLALIALSTTFFFQGIPGVQQGLLAASLAFALTLPLVLAKSLGAGDMKLMVAFGLASDPSSVLWVVIYSFIWGALLGLFQVILKKEIGILFKNVVSILTFKDREKLVLHKIPYTIALMFGWLTLLSQQFFGGSL